MKRIGIFGGSFNPVHIGHTMLASYMAQWGGFDEVWLTLSPLNPLKADDSTLIADVHRLTMLRRAVAASPLLKVCDIELEMPRPNYTVDTLAELSRRHGPDTRFTPIVGSDNWLAFDRWRSGPEIIERHGLVVYPRPGYDVAAQALPSGVTLVKAPEIEISSSFIRDAIFDGRDMTFFLPPGVYDYIKENNLYTPGDPEE